MAAELNFQAIVDLVGDKLRELFNTGDMSIRWRDESTNLVHSLYVYEHGQRLALPPTKYKPDAKLAQALQTGAPVVLRDRAETDAMGIKTTPGTDAACAVHLPADHRRRPPARRSRSRASSARMPTAMRR